MKGVHILLIFVPNETKSVYLNILYILMTSLKSLKMLKNLEKSNIDFKYLFYFQIFKTSMKHKNLLK